MTVVLCLTPAALPTARLIRNGVPGAQLHGLAGRVEDADELFADTMAHMRELFAQGKRIIGVCAAGILVRAVAPLLADKQSEPAVLAVAVDGSAVVPLLGGHHGANQLARQVAMLTGGQAAITTAGDVALGLALDEPPAGWRVGNPAAIKPVTAALLAGGRVRLEVEAGNAEWLDGLPTAEDGQPLVRVTDHAVATDEDELLLHPPVLALGVGCERDCDPAELAGLVDEVLAANSLAAGAIACVVSVDLKACEPAVLQLAQRLGVPARFFTPARLADEAPRLANPSEVVAREIGCPGVSEGAALAAAGPQAILVVEKTKSKRATLAIARSPDCIDAGAVGRGRGRLSVVGIGPGWAGWRAPEASAAIAAATDLVGYGLYLDLLGDAALGKARHESDLGAEADRARMALELAGRGKDVALICSGDAGIYALATLVFELLDRERHADWMRAEIQVIPGISALQAAAARAGAPVNHDFCTISLSDLLTPWETIEKRLQAAAAADFVVCFYNPVSKRRRDQLARARDILLSGRGPETPVILARQLGRPEESIRIITLGELTPDHADMLTLVLVGSSETRRMRAGSREWVYTPRGYAKKLS
ncbi:precorrin-3B C(17)-methyltransferase [Magnetospirillum moscoviense]|uniref:Precorrin-3B methylase n=1 Tax=Magnetospirillum moscoviense TaxID=1437059 RepID=A0A178MZ88_9PROT|nr:precorrin-3B C(17)-methyltransferase [Magnetospirillum moscoviense]OAN65516.1 precorrin-3B methylase [Magnetospirillum moscoviense]